VTALSSLNGAAFKNVSKARVPGNRKRENTKIRLVMAHPSSKQPCWPNIGYDFEKNKAQFLKQIKKHCPDVDFYPITARSDEDAQRILRSNGAVDGYIVYLSGCLWANVPEIIASSGQPVVLVDNLFAGSGEFLTEYAKIKRKGLPVIGVSSSSCEDVAQAVRCVDSIKKLSTSTVLVVGSKPDQVIEDSLGTQILGIDFSEINRAYNEADKVKAKKWAEVWMHEAEKVIEPSRIDVEQSAQLYVAMLNLLDRYQAQAIAVNCLGGFYGGQMPAYPCLGFMQLDNDGRVGACEADQRSAITKLLMTYLVGRPGFISDPVIDTAKNQIIYAHCVAPTKVFGPEGNANPYHIRSHSEDRKGACDRSLMPLGKMTTTMMWDARKKQVIVHQGITVENVDLDRACRNKLAVEIKGDVYKLFDHWDQWGWHRVTFFGDFKRQIIDTATLLGFEVVYEA
jgi:L-fucose isomerase-like protein